MRCLDLPENPKDVDVYRRFLAFSGIIYLSWWFAVQFLLPKAFNPLLSRLAVVILIFTLLGLSFTSIWIRRHIRILFIASVWLITFHYYYLFYGNSGDINWVIGDYITVIATSLVLFSGPALLSYSCFVLLISLGLVFLIPPLQHSVFLPGLITIIIQANIGLRSRLRILKNLAEEKAAVQTMAESVRIRDDFISIASHELKTPLTALKLKAQLIKKKIVKPDPGIYTPETVNGFVFFVNKLTDRLSKLVEAMLDVSRISTGRLHLDVQEIDLPVLIRELAEPLQVSNTEPLNPTIVIEAPEHFLIKADRHYIEQAVENLLTNAIKYGNGKPVKVEIRGDRSCVLLTIEDQGIGIAPENIERIFNRFERIDTLKNVGGFGLGLYLARQIVEDHGGNIKVDSKLGFGSRFTVRLPF